MDAETKRRVELMDKYSKIPIDMIRFIMRSQEEDANETDRIRRTGLQDS